MQIHQSLVAANTRRWTHLQDIGELGFVKQGLGGFETLNPRKGEVNGDICEPRAFSVKKPFTPIAQLLFNQGLEFRFVEGERRLGLSDR
jgi:hypothetical protein